MHDDAAAHPRLSVNLKTLVLVGQCVGQRGGGCLLVHEPKSWLILRRQNIFRNYGFKHFLFFEMFFLNFLFPFSEGWPTAVPASNRTENQKVKKETHFSELWVD